MILVSFQNKWPNLEKNARSRGRVPRRAPSSSPVDTTTMVCCGVLACCCCESYRDVSLNDDEPKSCFLHGVSRPALLYLHYFETKRNRKFSYSRKQMAKFHFIVQRQPSSGACCSQGREGGIGAKASRGGSISRISQ